MMSTTQLKPTYDEIHSIALRSATGSYLVGCVLILAVLWDVGYGPNILGLAVFGMLFFAVVPSFVAATVTGLADGYLRRIGLPIRLFVRTCTITVMVAMLSWVLALIVFSRLEIRL